MQKKDLPQDIAAMSVDQAIAELENQVKKMESGGMPLEELTAVFERGVMLSKHCREQLAKLERKIQVLTSGDSEKDEWSNFDASSGKRQDELPF